MLEELWCGCVIQDRHDRERQRYVISLLVLTTHSKPLYTQETGSSSHSVKVRYDEKVEDRYDWYNSDQAQTLLEYFPMTKCGMVRAIPLTSAQFQVPSTSL